MVNKKKLYLGLALFCTLVAAVSCILLLHNYMEGQKARAHFRSLVESVWQEEPGQSGEAVSATEALKAEAPSSQTGLSGTGWAGGSVRGDAFGVLGVEEKLLEKQNKTPAKVKPEEQPQDDGAQRLKFGNVQIKEPFSELLQNGENGRRFGELSLRAFAGSDMDVFSSRQEGGEERTVLARYEKLHEQNQDFIGWVRIEDTMLDFPVMYTPLDAEYYLHRLFDGDNSLYGTPFLDARCSLEPRSTNMIIHGHSMSDGTMFSTLLKYEDKSYFEAHPIIRFDTLYDEGIYEVVGVLKVKVNEGAGDEYPVYDFINGEYRRNFEVFSAYVHQNALYDTGKKLFYGDSLLTLMTCDADRQNGRIMVIAKRKTM